MPHSVFQGGYHKFFCHTPVHGYTDDLIPAQIHDARKAEPAFIRRDLSDVTYHLLSGPVSLSPKSPDELLFQIGEIAALRITGAQYLKTECIPITDPWLKTAWEHEIYRILVRAKDSWIKICIR